MKLNSDYDDGDIYDGLLEYIGLSPFSRHIA